MRRKRMIGWLQDLKTELASKWAVLRGLTSRVDLDPKVKVQLDTLDGEVKRLGAEREARLAEALKLVRSNLFTITYN